MNQLFILASPSNHSSTAAFWKALQISISGKADLSVYCLHEGAQSLGDERLANARIRLFACPRAAESVSKTPQEHVTLGGPGLLAELIDRANSIQTFSPA